MLVHAALWPFTAGPLPAQEHELPAPRAIPGLTVEDRFPGACVDCHVADPDRNLDERFGTLFQRWRERPDASLLARLQPLAPAGVILVGDHPEAKRALTDVPRGCLRCHGEGSKEAPSLGPMVHLLHLTGGEFNVFLTVFRGECTHCHKLDAATGSWTVPSGPER